METYDFIVIGGGPGGCVSASRLSEDPNISIALLDCHQLQTYDCNAAWEQPLGFRDLKTRIWRRRSRNVVSRNAVPLPIAVVQSSQPTGIAGLALLVTRTLFWVGRAGVGLVDL